MISRKNYLFISLLWGGVSKNTIFPIARKRPKNGSNRVKIVTAKKKKLIISLFSSFFATTFNRNGRDIGQSCLLRNTPNRVQKDRNKYIISRETDDNKKQQVFFVGGGLKLDVGCTILYRCKMDCPTCQN